MRVQRYEGHMALRSELGKDIAIMASWPLQPSSGDQAVVAADINAGKETALVVDDEPDVLDVLVAIFEIMGYEVLAAKNGAEALEHLGREPKVNVMLTDVVMPGMDGVSLAREARELLPDLRIILASGFMRDQRHDLGGFPFLQKPFLMADVAKLLRQGS